MTTAEEHLDRLYRLLPTVHRVRDYEQGQPLRALLQVIAEQVQIVEEDIRRLYDNWFIETCDDWTVPYIADLLGYTPVPDAGLPGDPSTALGLARNRVLVPRREVANTIRYRRRKGTLALLELLARDVAGWPARVVEFRGLLARTAALDSQASQGARTVDLRSGRELDRLGGPFDEMLRIPDARRISSRRTQGRFNIPNVGLFVWRLQAYSVTKTQAHCAEDVGPHCYTFAVLGNDAPLFNRPRAESSSDAIAGELNVPAPIDRRVFSQEMTVEDKVVTRASSDYYGLASGTDTPVAQSVAIWAPGWPPKEADDGLPIPRTRIVPADLDGWRYLPENGQVAVDPVRGRIAFPPRQLPRRGVSVSYHYGFSADLGGGEYDRPLSEESGSVLLRVRGKDELQNALAAWKPAAGETDVKTLQPKHGVIEIADSGVYVMPITIFLEAGNTLQIRAAERTRPVLRLLDWQTDLPDSLVVTGQAGSRFTLDGIMVAGRGLRVEGEVRSLTIRHSTLVPGWSLEHNCEPRRPSEPSIELTDNRACIVIDRSIVGSIQINNSEVTGEPSQIHVSDSVIDATGHDCDGPECEAIGAAGSLMAHAVVRISRCTVIGKVMTHAIELAEDSIFLGCVTVARRQLGCMRFCYVAHGSRTPKRFNCQPDLAEAAARGALPSAPTDDEVRAVERDARRRVRPLFNSTRYGTPTYCQLATWCPAEIARGGSGECEMGVFYRLFQPQRMANLQTRLEEFVPAAADVGIIVVT